MIFLIVLATLFSYSRADITKLESCLYTSTTGQCDAGEVCTDVCVLSPSSCNVGLSCNDAKPAYVASGMVTYGACYTSTSTYDYKVTCEDTSGGGGGSDTGTVVGIVIGCLVGVALIAVIVYFVYKKKAL